MVENKTPFDVTTLKGGELVSYTTYDSEKGFCVETGEVRAENFYEDGVMVYGDDWKQYAQKWHIVKVVKGDTELYLDKDYADILSKKSEEDGKK